MRFGLGLPQMTPGDPLQAVVVREFAMTAEEEGYDSLWVVQSGVRKGTAPFELSGLSLLSYVAALTNRARLGTAVLLPGLTDPRWLAQELTSIDHLSGGRLDVGVGLGLPVRAELLGIPRSEWPARFEESIDVLLALWAPGVADYSGRFWDVAGITLEPKPVQTPHPPLWFGASAPAALRRAARLGDGWIGAGSATTGMFGRQLGLLRDMLDQEGRSSDAFQISKRVYIVVDDDERAAEDRVRAFFDRFYGNPDLGAEVTVYGPVAKCIEQIGEVHEAGTDHVVLHPLFDFMAQLEAITDHVLPQLP